MSYQVLARKWRPQSFSELKGQSAARRALFNAVKSNRLHHALLFTGPRGTGKTSTARILAKILRCTNLQENFTPCNKCKDCEEVAASRNLDVLEIDGASNNGVDSIRELRDQVNFNPSSGTKKVYIIDEVHMLSISAFNALLKTLEEPPDNVYFVMATTEAHKLPKTILSRCQRYDFKPVPVPEVMSLLKEVCASEKIEYDEEALFLIAQTGEGCVRDSLSFLDQCISFSEGKLTKEKITENLGATDISAFKELLGLLIGRDSVNLVTSLKKLRDSHIDPQNFLESLILHIKNVILFKVDQDSLKASDEFSESQKEIYVSLSNSSDLEDLYILFDICFKGSVDLAKAFDAFLLLEMTLLKAGTAPYYNELSGVEAAPLKQEAQPKKEFKKPPLPPQTPTQPRPQQKKPVQKSSLGGWAGFVDKVKMENPVVGSKLERCEYKYSSEDKLLKISVGDKNSFLREQVKSDDFLNLVQGYLKNLWGGEIKIEYQNTLSDAPTDLKPSVQEQKDIDKTERLAKMREEVENHDVIKSLRANHKVEITEIREQGDS